MRCQLLLLLGLAAVCLAYDWQAPYSDAEDMLDDLIDDSGRLRTSKALDLIENHGLNVGIRGRSFMLPFPILKAAAVVTLGKIALLVLLGTGTIPTTTGDKVIPAALEDLKAMLNGVNTVTAIVEIFEPFDTIAGEVFLAQATTSLGGSGTTLITGTLEGLDATETFRIDVATNGNLMGDCDLAGDVYSSESGGVFVSDSDGHALFVIQVADAPLRGVNSVMGRSVVITKESDLTERLACGVIVTD